MRTRFSKAKLNSNGRVPHYTLRGWPNCNSGIVDGDGREWDSFNAYLKDQGTSLRELAFELIGRITLEEFREVLHQNKVYSYDQYRQALRENRLDRRCPSRPKNYFSISWEEILRYKYNISEFREYLIQNRLDSANKFKLHMMALCRDGVPNMRLPWEPRKYYKYDFWPRADVQFFSHDELRSYLAKMEITTSKQYVQAYKAGQLDERCPSTSTLRNQNWCWPDPRATVKSLGAAKLVATATDKTLSLRQAAKLLNVSIACVSKIRRGEHRFCAEVGYVYDGKRFPRILNQ